MGKIELDDVKGYYWQKKQEFNFGQDIPKCLLCDKEMDFANVTVVKFKDGKKVKVHSECWEQLLQQDPHHADPIYPIAGQDVPVALGIGIGPPFLGEI